MRERCICLWRNVIFAREFGNGVLSIYVDLSSDFWALRIRFVHPRLSYFGGV